MFAFDVEEVRLPFPNELVDLLGREAIDELDLVWASGESENFAEGGFLHTGEVVLPGAAEMPYLMAPQSGAAGGYAADAGA